MGSSLTEAHLSELKQIFELFDGDADGLLDVAEVGAILQLVGDTALTEAEVLDMVTEVAPEQRKLPFSEFVNIMCRPMVGKEALAGEIRKSFKAFAAEGAARAAELLRHEVVVHLGLYEGWDGGRGFPEYPNNQDNPDNPDYPDNPNYLDTGRACVWGNIGVPHCPVVTNNKPAQTLPRSPE